MNRRSAEPRASRSGEVLHTAVAFGATSLLLVLLAIGSLTLPHAGSPRRTAFAVGAIILAAVGLAVSIGIVLDALARRRALRGSMRPGERLVGTFSAEILRPGPQGRAEPVTLVLTDQRLLIQPEGEPPDRARSIEHAEIAEIEPVDTVVCSRLRRCVLQRMRLGDGEEIQLRLSASVGLDFADPRDRYLRPRERQLRVVVTEAHGPTPSRPTQPLSTLLVDDSPTVCLIELGEHYLRAIGEHSSPMADLFFYFHWRHMRVAEPRSNKTPGLPEAWLQLRLVFHEDSSLVITGPPASIRRVHQWALKAGAQPLPEADTGD